jgi:uncharacterized protein (TIGR03083 family)
MADAHDLSAQVRAFLSAADADGRALLEAARSGWDVPVPHCPGWDSAELVRHMGGILGWMAAIVGSGERVARRTLEAAPEDPADLPSWYLAALPRTLEVLGTADPASVGWTFSSTGDRRVWWWCRRLAVEVAVHRWDAEFAQRGPYPRAAEAGVAEAGVEEFMTEFLPGLLESAGLGGTLHVHATDGPTEWSIDLAAPASARPEHTKADTAIRGTQSDLLLWLNNRGPLESIEVLGNHEIVGQWGELRF